MSAFCSAVEARQRCVAPAGHVGKHDFQPLSAASVRAIIRQETQDARLGDLPRSEPVRGALQRQEAEASTRLDGETYAI